MKARTLITSFLFLLFISSQLTGHAQKAKWELLGTRKVNFSLDRDVIPVTFQEGTFSAIKIGVAGGALNMHKCVIHFENGDIQEVPLRHTFGRVTPSRTIDLPGNKRFIEKIVFWYDSKNLRPRRATLRVWGKH